MQDGSSQDDSKSQLEDYLQEVRSNRGSRTNTVRIDAPSVNTVTDREQNSSAKAETKGNTVLSLCDGMGGLALSLQMEGLFEGLQIDSYIAVELDKDARQVARVANDVTPGFTQGLNGKHDIFQITEEEVQRRWTHQPRHLHESGQDSPTLRHK